ncbi:hypothetical protein [Rhizobium miluonense]|jgi:hypothetical protein|uniref:Uncharacterized protein n=1 Tax=Rhizobium miluonense TaxID=411945 RepID=A0ABU1SXJ4_9HYPH|nr:hypothetical protein [Rhizobium miluonense]MDR6903686.1 hypothetical protein [Rhizobium miluonense]
MIRYKTKKPAIAGPRAAVYGFAKKYELGNDEAERIYLKIGELATEEDFLAEAKLVSADFRIPNDKPRTS